MLALYAAALLVVAMGLPWWRMESRAPQYGQRVLVIDVSPTGVRGDIKELDGLGHYVGMRTIDTFAPLERKLAPFAVGLVALAALSLPLLRSRRQRLFAAAVVVAVPFGFIADLWAWQRYAVTHLEPTAALSMIANRIDARVYGHYSVAQFHVDASFASGFWLVLVAVANAIGFVVTEWAAAPTAAAASPPAAASSAAPKAAAAAAVLVSLLWPAESRAATLRVGPGARFQTISQAVAAAAPGDTVRIAAGVYREHVVVTRPVVLSGEGEAVIDGEGTGTLLRITAGPTIVRGLSFRGSGDSLLAEDAAIRVDRAPGSQVERVRIDDCLFGVLVVMSPQSRVAASRIVGKDIIVPRRGDGIRIFASDGTNVDDNTVTKSRDLAIWSSSHVDARRNRVTDSRYGLHYMYAEDNVFEDNVFERNQTGGAVMYSKRLTLRRNRFEGSRGPSAHGLLIKDAADVMVESNWFLDNTRGLFLSELFSGCTVRGNVMGGNDAGIALEPDVAHVVFTENALIANRVQVEVLGTRQTDRNEWSKDGKGNYWSDYVGFDADGDGVGDVPYRLEQFFEDLAGRWPALGLLRMGPASQALELAARAFPVGQPRPTVTDEHPLLRAPAGVAAPRPVRPEGALAVAGVFASAAAAVAAARSRRTFGGREP